MTKLSLRCQIEIWHEYGAYLSGIACLACENPGISFDELWRAIEASGSTGGWSKQAIRNTFEEAR